MGVLDTTEALAAIGLAGAAASMLAREVEDRALDVAPCLAALDANDPRVERVHRVLVRAAMRWASMGWGGVRSQSVGQYSVTWNTASPGELTGSEVARLKDICGASGGEAGPIGSFPAAANYAHLFAAPRGV